MSKLDHSAHYLEMSVQGIALMLRDVRLQREGAPGLSECLSWAAAELERLAGEAYHLADESVPGWRPEDSAAKIEGTWCSTPLCCLKPGHEGDCQ